MASVFPQPVAASLPSWDSTCQQHLVPLNVLLGFQNTTSSVLSPLSTTPGVPFALIRVWQTRASGPNPGCHFFFFFLNKTLLEHNHAHSFTYHLWLLSWYSGRVEWWPRRRDKAEHIYYVALYGKSMLTPGIDSLGTLVFLLPYLPLLVSFDSCPHLLDL